MTSEGASEVMSEALAALTGASKFQDKRFGCVQAGAEELPDAMAEFFDVGAMHEAFFISL